MEVSIIVPTVKGREHLLKRLLDSLPKEHEVIIMDDESMLLAEKRNKGAAIAKGEYLLFIDDDNFLRKWSIDSAVKVFEENSSIGIVGFMALYDTCKLKISDGGSNRNYLTGFTRGINTNRVWGDISKKDYEVDEVANAFMVKSKWFRRLGGFDELRFPIDLDEADLCKRAKDCFLKVVICPMARCYHKSQTYSHLPDFRRTLNAYFMGRNRILYQRKHNSAVGFLCYFVLFMPVFVIFYMGSLVYRKKQLMISHFLKGVFDGIFGRKQNQYQKA